MFGEMFFFPYLCTNNNKATLLKTKRYEYDYEEKVYLRRLWIYL